MIHFRRWLATGLLLAAALLGGSDAAAQPDSRGFDTLRPGDLIRLRIWREPDLSGDFPVNENGAAILPRIGRVQVLDEPTARLQARVIAAYEEFLQHSSIEVVFLRRVQVLGAVRTPGLYPVDPTMTVADAVALAGGATGEGDPRRVELIRGGRRVDVQLSADTRMASSAIQSGDQLFVPERSWLRRNTGLIIGSATGALSLLIALIR
ncbi:MAG TPA: SLBB domain-containing protein [Longimicrobium sp.]|nr:SLBB domain-containing protein [Longimicrobium sp.]